MTEITFTVPGNPVGKGRAKAARRGRSGTIDIVSLKECLRYEKETGLFYWLIKGCRNSVGDVAGTTCIRGYVNICVKNRIYKAHRLAWLYVYGSWPKNQIDHIDRNKSNNSISNLRDVPQSLNQQNRVNHRNDNKINMLGVSLWSDGRSGFKSQINVGGKIKYLGTYDTKEQAHEAYLIAKNKYHPGVVC